jgi:mannose-6-phosphate isomerase
VKPIRLGRNQVHRFYKGGAAIARFRGVPHGDEYAPEDWVGSTTSVYGSEDTGVTRRTDSGWAPRSSRTPRRFSDPLT